MLQCVLQCVVDWPSKSSSLTSAMVTLASPLYVVLFSGSDSMAERCTTGWTSSTTLPRVLHTQTDGGMDAKQIIGSGRCAATLHVLRACVRVRVRVRACACAYVRACQDKTTAGV